MATAGISWRSVARDLVMVFVVGVPFLYSVRINWEQRNADGQVLNLLGASVIGVVCVVGGLYGGIRGVYESVECMRALSSGRFAQHTGSIELVDRFGKPGGREAVYRVAGAEFRTHETGLDCDCGYLVPLGRGLKLSDGQMVEVKLLGDRAISVRELGAGS